VRKPLTDLAKLLSASVGDAKALDVVSTAARRANITTGDVDQQQALAILEKIASEPGLLGIAARFAKSRALLAWK
jgi:hypothetical protein